MSYKIEENDIKDLFFTWVYSLPINKQSYATFERFLNHFNIKKEK
jgi:hypothetical protein